MRVVVQRIKEASVSIGEKKIAEVGSGLLVLLGVAESDTEEQVQKLAQKIATLRIFPDEDASPERSRRMNLSVRDVAHSSSLRATLSNAERVGGEVLVISQFTLLADTSRGHRPSFIKAAEPGKAEKLYELFVAGLRKADIPVKTGKFVEYMQVSLVNDGPVTIILEA